MRILIIANAFPPINSSASIRALNYVNYLYLLGCDVHVITANYPKDFINYDISLQQQLNPNIKVYRIDLGKLYSKFYTKRASDYIKKEESNKNSKKSLSLFKQLIKTYITIPDPYFEWQLGAVQQGEKLLEKGNFDVIFSMHEAPSCHLVGYKLHKKFPHVKWVTYWSDPWTFDPNRMKQPMLRKYIEKRLEKKVVENADVFLFTTNQTKKLYESYYNISESKTDIVFRGFSKHYFSDLKEKGGMPKFIKEGKINIVHTGEIYTNLRDITPFLKAIRKIKQHHLDIYEKLNILLIGNIHQPETIIDYSDLKCINLIERLPYEEALKYMLHSDILILWGNKHGQQIPGKVYEYIGSESIITTIIGSDDDPLINFMKNIDKGPVIKNETDDIYETVLSLVNKIEENRIPSNWTKPVDSYEWKSVVKDLLEKIKK